MGVYDTVMVPCPQCGTRAEFQSKSGSCTLETYSLDEAPDDVLRDVNRHAPVACGKCGVRFGVEVVGPRPQRTLIARAAVWNDVDGGEAMTDQELADKVIDAKDPTRHTIVFPRYQQDIESQRRTLFHWADMDEVFEPWHRLLIPPHHNFPRAVAAVVTEVDKVRLQDVTDEDLAKLGIVWQDADAADPREAARAAYWARWDAANPEALAATNPLVQRVEFRYGWPEEGPRAA